MQNLIIYDREIKIKEFNRQRVVTFKDIDTVHQRPEGTAKRNFRVNKKYLEEGVDYFAVNKDELGTNFVLSYDFGKNAHTGTLITESGYLMLVKSFTDDLAWKVQRQLVNVYFKSNVQRAAESNKPLLADIPDNRTTQKTIQRLQGNIDALSVTLGLFNRYLEIEKAKNYQTVIAEMGTEIFLAADEIKRMAIGIKKVI